MDFQRHTILRVAPLLILASSFVVAQDNATKEEESERMRLELILIELNNAITDTPSPYHHNRAEVLFRLGHFAESVRDYDAATRYGSPHDENSCWERGLAQYYAGDYRSGGEQFARYHRVGALDIENGIWRFLCIAEDEGIEKARETMFEYPRQLRKPFPALLALYMDRGTADAVLAEAKSGTPSAEELTTNLFYGHYYLAKYYEIIDDNDRARTHLREALKHEIPHFMYACAEADAKRLELDPLPQDK